MKLAGIVYGMGQANAVDAMLCVLAARLRSEGYRLAGAIQHNTAAPDRPCSDMTIEDLASAQRIDVSTHLERAGGGCRLEPSALEDAAGLVAASLESEVDLVIINRFGKQEMAGSGFRGVIEAAVARDIPLLIALNGVHGQMWEEFHGGLAVTLAPEPQAVEAWCRSVLTTVQKSRPGAATMGTR
jgi:nucleoside-triphosphatase THEP1